MAKYATNFVLLCVCPVAIVLGSLSLADYSYRPSEIGELPSQLDSVEAILNTTDSDGSQCSTLLLFYHPHCPCTFATARCLQRMGVSFSNRLKFVAVAYCPEDEPDSWVNSPTTNVAVAIDSSAMTIDPDAAICRKFGVRTSGHVLLYDGRGQLIFSGGITPGRGHEGDSRAARDLLSKINGESGDLVEWPVFGCPIYSLETQQR